MICGMTYYQICWYFLIYSFGGWALEVVYHAVACGKVINRGFLNGPVCPVYGFGVLSVFAMMNTFQGSGYQLNDGMIFLFGVILATAVELIAGWLLDVCFHARWWDYSNKPLNFHGYICLEFSLIWGVAILLVVKVFQSFVEYHTSAHAPSIVGWMVVAILYALYLADLLVTVAVIQGLNRKLTRLDTIRANMRVISDKEATEEKVNKSIETLRKNKADLQKEFDELSSSIVEHTFVGQGRLIKAFPDMKHRDYLEVVQELKNKMRDRK